MGNKSVILLTNFWDAQACIKQKFLFYAQADKIYKINIDYTEDTDKKKIPVNYFIHSIALSHPDLTSLPDLKDINRLDVFCPTYEMIKRYKDDGRWDNYTKDYTNLLRNRKTRMSDWINSIAEDKIYFLCCWENTSGKSHCHREILHKLMCNSKVVTDKSIVIYRNGNEIKTKKNNPEQYEIEQSRMRTDTSLEIVSYHNIPPAFTIRP